MQIIGNQMFFTINNHEALTFTHQVKQSPHDIAHGRQLSRSLDVRYDVAMNDVAGPYAGSPWLSPAHNQEPKS